MNKVCLIFNLCLVVTIGYLSFSSEPAQAQTELRRVAVCINDNNGRVVLRRRCGKNLTRLTRETLEEIAPGVPGETGPAGPKGEPGEFSGSFISPNGNYSIDITDSGIVLSGPGGEIALADSLKISGTGIDIAADSSLSLEGGSGIDIDTSSTLSLQGSLITINGANKPVAGMGDSVAGGVISSGTATVLVGN